MGNAANAIFSHAIATISTQLQKPTHFELLIDVLDVSLEISASTFPMGTQIKHIINNLKQEIK